MQIPSAYYTAKIAEQELRWKCKLIFHSDNKSSATVATLTDADLVENTLQIESQSTSSSNFTVGGVSAKKCTLNINWQGIEKLKNANILKKKACFEVRVWLKTNDPDQDPEDWTLNTDETTNTSGLVKLGFFYIDQIQDNNYNTKIEAYDAMLAFDRTVTTTDQTFVYGVGATISGYMTRFATSCSDLTYEITVDLTNLPKNNSVVLYCDSDTQLSNYRELLGYLSQLAVGFFMINEDGNLVFKNYHTSADIVFDHKQVFNYSQGNETFQIRKVSTTAAAFDIYATTSETQAYNYADIFFNENPFLRYFFPEGGSTVPVVVQNIIDGIMSNIATTIFTSGEYQVPTRPDLECGDNAEIQIKVIDKTNDEIVDISYIDVLICSHIWKYQTYSTIKSLGWAKASGSSVQSTSKVKKSSSFTASNSIIRTIGGVDLNLNAGSTVQLFNLYFILEANMEAEFTITCTLSILTAGTFRLRIQLDGVDYITQPKQTVGNTGYFTFSYTYGTGAYEYDGQHHLKIQLISTDSFEASLIATDSQCLINATSVRSAVPEWTGEYELEDWVNSFDMLDALNMGQITDTTPTVVFSN